jgi:DDE superfamily endonuclease
MTPYRGTRYHLKEQRQADQRPENLKELFNLRYSSLRNVIERIFGVLKRQWQILGGHGCEYSINTQTDLFYALVGLYNFGRDHDKEETFEDESIEDEVVERQSDNIKVIYGIGNKWMEQKRDEIANRMWVDYQEYIQNR